MTSEINGQPVRRVTTWLRSRFPIKPMPLCGWFLLWTALLIWDRSHGESHAHLGVGLTFGVAVTLALLALLPFFESLRRILLRPGFEIKDFKLVHRVLVFVFAFALIASAFPDVLGLVHDRLFFILPWK